MDIRRCNPKLKNEIEIQIPPDKSISHRALMLSAMAQGTSKLTNLLDSQDVNSTAKCLDALGAKVEVIRRSNGSFDATVTGWGEAEPKSPKAELDCGNSGTTTRLLLGILAGYDVEATLVGDESLSQRPMKRVVEPLTQMGACFSTPESDKWDSGDISLPINIKGTNELHGIEYASPKASAQVKTSLMFAGLHSNSSVSLSEPYQSRNHTELMLPAFGASVDVKPLKVCLEGGQKLHACDISVPADPSSAMFFVVACALLPNSSVVLRGVGLNQTRIAGIEVAKRMGCNISIEQTNKIGLEPVGDIHIKYSPVLNATVVEPQEVPNLIDEIPVLALLATSAKGTTKFCEVSELRVKESNRLNAIIEGLNALGAGAREVGDDLEIDYGLPHKKTCLDPRGDHRLAMTWTIANRCLKLGGEVTNLECIDVSFPQFVDKLDALFG